MNIAYTVQKIDAAGLADARRRSMYRLSALVDSELRKPAGQRSRLTYADFSERLAGSPHGVTEHCWVAWTGRGQAIGIAWLTLRASAEFEAVGKVDIAVAAACRRRGLGSALLADIHSWAAGNGLDTLYSWAGVSSAGAGFLAARMERFRDEELWSVLDLARIDLDALESRTAQPPSAGLQAVGWYGPCPADLLETYASCHRRIGATARGSEADSRHVSAGLLADLEAAAVRAGESWLTVAAVTETGDVVGFSQITLPVGRVRPGRTGLHRRRPRVAGARRRRLAQGRGAGAPAEAGRTGTGALSHHGEQRGQHRHSGGQRAAGVRALYPLVGAGDDGGACVVRKRMPARSAGGRRADGRGPGRLVPTLGRRRITVASPSHHDPVILVT